ncbi:hypothetical protein A3E15_00630 [Candidatus Woesebacteria bacterium RIFCSPHIGHO2_12_FULL_42_9]|uniref:Large ribosomal subunit protein uL22 n=1 Tax=Candidatus Woesebacteria bacterium RIFCSPHIGHO2_12_FULL_42_9 TaxID=1802511 RepID=A0A1F8AVM8_9BACT|nr:MAG: hypothetical protein A3E15_00630 [Candidatus Woesebacteria bacterium RIFCSPHIGHO2_12_FULL_42_9]
MDIIATQKYLITSPKKLREVAAVAKKLSPARALEVLPFIGKRAAGPLSKVIKSAIANAKVKGEAEGDLVFKEIQISEGPRLKRWRAGAHGRAKPFKKRMSHIRVVLTSVNRELSSKDKEANKVEEKKGKDVSKD